VRASKSPLRPPTPASTSLAAGGVASSWPDAESDETDAYANERRAAAATEAAAALVRFASFARASVGGAADRTAALCLLPQLADHAAALDDSAAALAATTGCTARVAALLT